MRKRKIGRPTKFNPEVGLEICTRIATGQSLKQICRDAHMPHFATVLSWITRADQSEDMRAFYERYLRARLAQAETYLAEIRELEQDTDPANAKANEVRIRTLQWLCAKLNPRYSDHQRIEHSGTVKHERAVDFAPDWLKERLEGPGKAALERLRPVIDVEPVTED